MKGNNKVKWLKIAGWVLIPYIMILFTFKRLHGAKRIAGGAWAVVALVIAIASQSTPPTETVATTAPAASGAVDKPATTDKKQEAVDTETVAPVEEEEVAEPVVEDATVPEFTVSNERLGGKGIWYLTLATKSTNEAELKALVEYTRVMAGEQAQEVNTIHVGITEEGSGSNAHIASGKIAMSQMGLAQTGLSDIRESEFTYLYEPKEKAPSEETAFAEEPIAESKVVGEILDEQAVLDYTANMRGRVFLKEVQVSEHDISVSYHPGFKEYKAVNPDSVFTEEDYTNYFSSGDEINKIMMEESARLLKEFPAANEIKISLPFEGKTYSIDLQEDAAEAFFGVDFDTLKASDPTGGNAEWRAQVSDKYFNEADRQRFVNEFVTVQ